MNQPARSPARRPGSAHVIALIALIVALGGSAYALKRDSVGSKQVKNGSLTGKDVKDNSLKGGDVREGTLAEVPAAATVGGQRVAKVSRGLDAGTPATIVFDGAGLKLAASCDGGSEIAVTASTTKADSTIATTISGDGSPSEGDPRTNYLDNGDFGPGIGFDMLDGTGGNIGLIHFVYRARDGAVASGLLVTDELSAAGDCTIGGHVIYG